MRQKRSPGDKLSIPAADYNFMLEAAEQLERLRASGVADGDATPYETTFLRVRNDTGDDLDQFDVLGIGIALITAADNLAEWKRQAAFAGIYPEEGTHEGAFCVLLEPAGADDESLKWAAAAGIVPVGLTIATPSNTWDDLQSAGYLYADIQETEDFETCLKAALSGSARIIWAADENEVDEDDVDLGWRWARVRLGNGDGGITQELEICQSDGTPATLTITNGKIVGIA